MPFLALLLVAFALAAPAHAAPRLTLERVVFVTRHGVRPPTMANAVIDRYAAKPWPKWNAAPGELTPHGALTVRLMGESLAQTYHGLRSRGCPPAGTVTVWADGHDQRTRLTGDILAETFSPGCGAKASYASGADPTFNGDAAACTVPKIDANAELQAVLGHKGLETPATRASIARLQSVVAPQACRGGTGYCLAGEDKVTMAGMWPRIDGPLMLATFLAEDVYLEYADGMPLTEVGWGKIKSAADIAPLMAAHERLFGLLAADKPLAVRAGAPMARLILAFLAGDQRAAAPAVGEATAILGLAGHDSNLAFMAGVFGVDWALPGEPEATAPATTLAFELWRDPSGARFVRAVVYYETLDQLRSLRPAKARSVALAFSDCSSGPMRSCPLATLSRRTAQLVASDCG